MLYLPSRTVDNTDMEKDYRIRNEIAVALLILASWALAIFF